MNYKHAKLVARSLVVAAFSLTSACAFAAATTWTLNTGGTWTAGGANGVGNSAKFTSGGVGVTATAWGANSPSGTAYSQAWVGQYGGGLGVGTALEGGSTVTSNEHTLDNNPQTGLTDILVLKFDTPVALDKISVGFVSTDADIVVMAYNGGSDLGSLISGKTSAAAVSTAANWAFLSYIGDGNNTTAESVPLERSIGNANSQTASWWVIAAYNSGFGTAKNGGSSITSPDTQMDMVKVLSVTTKDTPRLPEPASLALVGVALVGAFGARRRVIS